MLHTRVSRALHRLPSRHVDLPVVPACSFAFSCLPIASFSLFCLYRLVADLVRATQHLHGLNIVHRDIKPANLLIFWTEERGLHGKLGDFGLSRGEFSPPYRACELGKSVKSTVVRSV